MLNALEGRRVRLRHQESIGTVMAIQLGDGGWRVLIVYSDGQFESVGHDDLELVTEPEPYNSVSVVKLAQITKIVERLELAAEAARGVKSCAGLAIHDIRQVLERKDA